MKIKHYTGEELKRELNGEIKGSLGFHALEYFFTIYEHKNYIILYNEEKKIIGQVTYQRNKNDFLMVSISITANNKGLGYSKLLLKEYLKILKDNSQKVFKITPYSEEGEMCLDRNLTILTEDHDMSMDFIKESSFQEAVNKRIAQKC